MQMIAGRRQQKQQCRCQHNKALRGVTMSVGISVTLAVTLCLGTTVLDATYLERPVWVADKGRQQAVPQGNEETRPSLFQAANEPSWVVPEPYRNGGVNPDRVDNQQWNQPSQELANKGRPSQPAWMNQQQQHKVVYQKPYPAPESTKQQQGWKPENSPLNIYQSQLQTQEELHEPNRMDGYKPKPDTDTKLSFDKPKQDRKPVPVPSKPEDMLPNTGPVRPQEVQQSYNPYLARPEQYQPRPVYVEPEYQAPYYGFPSLTEPDQYKMQKPANKQPSFQTLKPVEESNKVRKPTQQENQVEQVPSNNMGYYPYQEQAGGWYPYQQNPPAGLQASVQTEPEKWIGEPDLPLYQLPSFQSLSYDREPVAETLKQQANRNPAQPPRTEQLPNRPLVQRQPEQPNRMPSNGWEVPYKPAQPEAVKANPKPQQQRPAIVNPTYNRQPDTSYWDGGDDEEEEVRYEKPVTRFDARCPRDDNPAKPVHFPSATSCVKFQKCFNGIAYEMSCPPGLEFDSKSNRCDYPARARCSL